MRSGALLWFLAVSGALVSCGGGDGTATSPQAPLTGTLIDSPVQGLPYSTQPSGLSGLTGPNGEFLYRPGDIVVFDIKAIPPLQAPAQPIVTPFTLLKKTLVEDVQHEWPVNLSRYLLALDTTPGSEVITIPPNLSPLPPLALTSFSFEADMAAAGIPIAPKADAIAHLKKQFAIWGSWSTTATPAEVLVVTFFPDGTFLLGHDDDAAMVGGKDGVEFGSYRWNANTSDFTFSIAANMDGTGGFSNPGPGPYSFVIDASGNTAVLHLGPNASHDILLTRLVDSSNVLVGAWTPDGNIGPTVVAFASDGTMMLSNQGVEGVPDGIERGTYTYDPATGILTLTITLDTNGEFGFSDGTNLPDAGTEPVFLSSNVSTELDYMIMGSGPDRTFFHRIKVP